MLPIYDDLIVAGQSRMGEEYLLNLRWEEVHATYNEHIVRATPYAQHTYGGAATGTGIMLQGHTIASAIAQERQGFAGKASEDQFADLAIRQAFAGIGVNHLRIEVVFVDV